MKPVSERRKNQRGFALLIIFLMAAAIALMLYIQMPRVSFEAERDKEQLLIDRGEQYKRAIQLYYMAYQRYPSKLEDLENTNDKRYLRRRYVNPYTGKDDWRLVHINGGMLTDSLVQKAPAAGAVGTASPTQLAGSTSAPVSGFTSTNPTGSTDPTVPPPVNQAVLQRPSDRTLPTNNTFNQNGAANPFPGAVGQANPFASQLPPTYNSNDPANYPPMSLYPNGYNAPPIIAVPGQQAGVPQPFNNQPGFNSGLNQPGLNQPGFNQTGINQPGFNQPGFNQTGINQPGTNQGGVNPQIGPIPNQNPQFPGQSSNGGLPGGYLPGVQTPPGLNPNFPNQFPAGTDPNNPGANPYPNPQPFQPVPVPGAFTPGGGQPNPAASIINNLLTTPRQPPAGLGIASPQPTTGGGGIAGIASSYMGPSIMSYGERTQFEEWEFVFQPKTATVPGGGQPGQNPANPNGQNGQTNSNGQPNFNGQNGQTNPFGQPTGQPPIPGFPNPPGMPPQTGLPPGFNPPGLPPGVSLTP